MAKQAHTHKILKILIKGNGYDYKSFGKKIGKSKSTVMRIVSNAQAIKKMSLEDIEKIAAVFGKTLIELIEMIDNDNILQKER